MQCLGERALWSMNLLRLGFLLFDYFAICCCCSCRWCDVMVQWTQKSYVTLAFLHIGCKGEVKVDFRAIGRIHMFKISGLRSLVSPYQKNVWILMTPSTWPYLWPTQSLLKQYKWFYAGFMPVAMLFSLRLSSSSDKSMIVLSPTCLFASGVIQSSLGHS